MESKMEKNKVEWEGKHITVPEPFTRVEHLLRFIPLLLSLMNISFDCLAVSYD